MIRSVALDKDELLAIKAITSSFTLKPTMYIANVNEDGLKITRI